MNALAPYAKAITGAIVAGLTALATGLSEGGIDPQEWVAVAIAFFVGLGAVYAIPNSEPVE